MKSKRGRKIGSNIRDNIAIILFYVGDCHGYDIYKKYIDVFGKVSMRSVYYHLTKGCEIGIFGLKTIEINQGDYSWGIKAQRNIYSLINKEGMVPNSKIRDKLQK